ncbi:MAG: histidine--tRNA ligase [bacterium]
MTERGKLDTEPYKGVRDFYPEDWAQLTGIFSTARNVLELWGYEEYNASPMERSELYLSKGNEEIINEQTYTFTDRGGRSVTLRPEMTPTLARMIAGKRRELAFPLRWFSIGSRFRYERPQKGRLREFYQIDVDLVGLPAGEADREIVTVASRIMKAFGAKREEYVIRINSRKLLSCAALAAGLDPEAMRAYTRLLDKKEKMPPAEWEAAARALSQKDPLDEIESATNEGVRREKDRILAFVEALHEEGIGNALFDPALVRGFDYYTDLVFEVFDTDPANPRALFGGGRYDELVALFGGDPLPAVGFAVGDVSFADFLETHGYLPRRSSSPEIYIGTEKDGVRAAETFADELRMKGVRAFTNLRDKALGDQAKEAEKRGIRYFLAYGKDEAGGKAPALKDLPQFETTTLVDAAAVALWIAKNR